MFKPGTTDKQAAATFAEYPRATLVIEEVGHGYGKAKFTSQCKLTGDRISYGETVRKLVLWSRSAGRFEVYVSQRTVKNLNMREPLTVNYPDGHEEAGEPVRSDDPSNHLPYTTAQVCTAGWWKEIDAKLGNVLSVYSACKVKSFRRVEGGWQKCQEYADQREDVQGQTWRKDLSDKQLFATFKRTTSDLTFNVKR